MLRCPRCGASELTAGQPRPLCKACTGPLSIVEGVADLSEWSSTDTHLDVESYAGNLPQDLGHSVELAQFYISAMTARARIPLELGLEIGSGSGQLSCGLCSCSPLQGLICSDVSMHFLRILKRRLDPLRHLRQTCLCRLDANRLPFGDCVLSAVFGHSVLHHLARFENTLQEVHRVLRPGGAAMFGEPIMDHFSMLSLIAAVILEMDHVRTARRLSPSCRNYLDYVAGLSSEKRANLCGDRARLSHVEDKFVFEIAAMRELAKAIGFSGFDVVQHSAVEDLGASLMANLYEEARGAPGATDGLEHYRFVCDMVTERYGRAMDRTASHGFAFFVLVK